MNSKSTIGLLIPTTNWVMKEECLKLTPKTVSIIVARLGNKRFSLEDLTKMNDYIEKASYELKDKGVDVIAYGCTTGSFMNGIKYENEITKRINKISGVPGITASGSVVKALSKLGIKKISVASPYPDNVNILAKKFFEEAGFEVKNIQGLKFKEPRMVADVKPKVSYELAKSVDTFNSEGIFISCTNFRTIEILEKLEKELKKPVISSNQAIIWNALRTIKNTEKIKGYGCLLEQIN